MRKTTKKAYQLRLPIELEKNLVDENGLKGELVRDILRRAIAAHPEWLEGVSRNSQPRYPVEFKQDAVAYAREHGIDETVRLFGVAKTSVANWLKRYQ